MSSAVIAAQRAAVQRVSAAQQTPQPAQPKSRRQDQALLWASDARAKFAFGSSSGTCETLGEGTSNSTATVATGDGEHPGWGKQATFVAEQRYQSTTSRPSRHTLFPDAEGMKKKVRGALLKKEYNVSQFYHKTGLFPKIATNFYFEHMTLGVISFNALWIAIDTDNNDAATLLDAQPLFQIMEHLFCFYFSLEWYVRFMSFARKKDGLKDAWFTFDSILVLMMVMETWVLTIVFLALGSAGSGGGLGNASILRLFRLLRLSRLARMLRSMPELMILIKGMVAASRSVFFTMALLFILMYLFSIALRQLTMDTEVGDALFPSVPEGMYTLLVQGVFLDSLEPTANKLGQESLVYAVIFFIFISLAALMVMNMLIGVLCEVVSAVASTEKEEMTVGFVKGKMKSLLEALDEDRSQTITKTEFIQMMDNPEAIRILHDVGVDPCSLVDLADSIFDDEDADPDEGRSLDFEDFMEIVLDLRGSNTASVKHIRDLTNVVRQEIGGLADKLHVGRRQTIALRNSPAREVPPMVPVHPPPGESKPLPTELRSGSWIGSKEASVKSLRSVEGARLVQQEEEVTTVAPSVSTTVQDAQPSISRSSSASSLDGKAVEEELDQALNKLLSAVRKVLNPELPGAPVKQRSNRDMKLRSWAMRVDNLFRHEKEELRRIQSATIEISAEGKARAASLNTPTPSDQCQPVSQRLR